MTPGVRRILQLMKDNQNTEDGELVCEGLACYLGTVRVHRKTVRALLDLCAIKRINEPNSLDRYLINGTGRALLDYPNLEDELVKALYHKRDFQIKKGRIVFL